MSDKVAVVYIGPKPVKRDTVAGTRNVFPRHEPVPVEADIAHRLTDFPKVWIYAKDFKDHAKAEQEREEAQAQAQAKAEAAALAAAEEACMVVTVKGQEIDLNKLNSAKLTTLIESEELDIPGKGSSEKVDDFRVRVRDAIRQGA